MIVKIKGLNAETPLFIEYNNIVTMNMIAINMDDTWYKNVVLPKSVDNKKHPFNMFNLYIRII